MQQQKVPVTKRLLSVEEVARELDVKKFLVKFWEKEFKITLDRPHDGGRCYSQENLKEFIAIKDLVHNKKMSLSQAKKQLKSPKEDVTVQAETFVAAEQEREIEPTLEVQPAVTAELQNRADESFWQNLQAFKEQLINFKQMLDLE